MNWKFCLTFSIYFHFVPGVQTKQSILAAITYRLLSYGMNLKIVKLIKSLDLTVSLSRHSRKFLERKLLLKCVSNAFKIYLNVKIPESYSCWCTYVWWCQRVCLFFFFILLKTLILRACYIFLAHMSCKFSDYLSSFVRLLIFKLFPSSPSPEPLDQF